MVLKSLAGIITLLVIVMLLNGCTGNSNYYEGIDNTDVPQIINEDMTVNGVSVYKGHTEKWAATYIVYQEKDSKKMVAQKYLKYLGPKPFPTGEISYDYDAGNDIGSGSVTAQDQPEGRVYYLGRTVIEAAPEEQSKISFLIKWKNQSDLLELKFERTK